MKTRSNVVWICSFPTSYRGSFVAHRNVNRSTPPPVLEPECKRRNVKNESLQGEGFNIQTHAMSTKCQSFPNKLQGAAFCPQQCHNGCAPTIFIWCHDGRAEMPTCSRTKGKVHPARAEMSSRLRPSQPVTGVIVKTQKCQDIVSPRGPTEQRRNAKILPPPPNLGHS